MTVEKSWLPTFLGIGSLRCGTTWLDRMLRKHPQIQMPKMKELNFFDKRLIREDLGWYQDQFEPANGDPPKSIRGEICPGYCRLSRPAVENIRRILSDLRIVFLLRNPIDRNWSQAVYELGRLADRTFDRVPIAKFMRHFDRRRTRYYNDYGRAIDVWSGVFGSEAVHVETFDRFRAEPKPYLADILRHVGADPSFMPDEASLSEKVFFLGKPSQGIEMPEILRWYVARQWREPVVRLNERLGGALDAWIEEMNSLERPGPRWRLYREVHRTLMVLPERLMYGAFEAGREFLHLRRGEAIIRTMGNGSEPVVA